MPRIRRFRADIERDAREAIRQTQAVIKRSRGLRGWPQTTTQDGSRQDQGGQDQGGQHPDRERG
jgi:hypothetical protein